MSSARGRVREVFLAAREMDAGARTAWLATACGGDAGLRDEVERLLAHDARAGAFLEQPALGADLARANLAAERAPGGLAPGETVAGYSVLRTLGEGGFGTVLEAEQLHPVRRRVALKVLREGVASPQAEARFAAERQTLARMEHAGIAHVYDAGTTSHGRPFLAMELVAGAPITEYCAQHAVALRARLELFLQACAAVQHAHQKGVIHRDLKPSNVLVAEADGQAQVKVIDFGIARALADHLLETELATRTGQWLGTPAYMSPEQAGSTVGDVDTRTDVYALGALLYELASGTPPFDPHRLARATPLELQRILLEEDPPRPGMRLSEHDSGAPGERALRSDLDWIALKTLEKERERRYPTVAELAADVTRLLADEPVLARPPSALYRLRKLARRNRIAFAAAVVVLLTLLLGAAGTTWQAVRAAHQRAAALKGKALAEEKANTVLAVLEFVRRMLAAAGPEIAQGREPTVREVLDATAREIESGFNGPEPVEAEFRAMLGNVYKSLGLLDDAAPHLEWAYTTRERIAGPDDPDTLRSLNDWAALVAERGDPATAEGLYARSIESCSRTLGPDHLRTLTAMNNRAQALRQLGRLDEAEPLLEKALEARLRTEGESDRFVMTVRHNLAGVALQRADWARAEPLLRAVLAARRESGGPKSPSTLETLSCLGLALCELGKKEEAEALLVEASEGFAEVLGPDHPLSVEAADRLAAARDR